VRVAERFLGELTAEKPLTVGDGIERYRQHLITKGNKPASFENTPLRLRRFFGSVLESSLSLLTERRCQALYDELRAQKSERTNRPLVVDTHRAYLADARSFGRWAAKLKLLRTNPLVEIEGVGRRNNRKPQLRHDEARRLVDLCLELVPTDDGAAAVLVALLMGLRAGEVVSRTVRDLDSGGTILWVDAVDEWTPKTTASRRGSKCPRRCYPCSWSGRATSCPRRCCSPASAELATIAAGFAKKRGGYVYWLVYPWSARIRCAAFTRPLRSPPAPALTSLPPRLAMNPRRLP
jgi:hypothetical protein